ncbi:unnamed protein product, partial [Ceratitis capitata]
RLEAFSIAASTATLERFLNLSPNRRESEKEHCVKIIFEFDGVMQTLFQLNK